MFGITMNRIIDGEYKDIPRMAIRAQPGERKHACPNEDLDRAERPEP